MLDIDDPEAFGNACITHGWEIPETFTVSTGKGFHHYYRLPPAGGGDQNTEVTFRNRSNRKEGWDIRATHGHVVAPGSIHPSGRQYEVFKDIEINPAPQWLLNESEERVQLVKIPRSTLSNIIDIPDPPDVGGLMELVKDAEIVRLIVNGAEKGRRSEVAYRIIKALLAEECDHDVIVSIFMTYPVGAKAQEKADPVAFLLDEIDRIESKEQISSGPLNSLATWQTDQQIAPMDELNDAPYRLMHIPTEEELPQKSRDLIREAHGELVRTLREYDNNVSPTHSEALHKLVNIYAAIAAKKISGRIAVPLPTGMGKTTSIVAALSTAYRLGQLQKTGESKGATVAVAASKVDQLCELYKALVSAGVPESFITLVHSYDYDPDVERDTDGLLPPGYAELPANDPAERVAAIMLLTHNRVKNGPTHIFDNTLQSRTLVIWDESLVATESRALGIERLMYGLPILDTTLQQLKRKDVPTDRVMIRKAEQTYEFMRQMLTTIQEEVEAQAKGRLPKILRFAPLDDGEFATMFKSIDWVVKRMEQGQFRENIGYLRNLLRMTAYDAAVHSGRLAGKEAVVRFNVVVPDNIENIVILDASTKINKLMMLDESIWTPKDLPELKLSYEETTVHRIGHKAGRSGIEEELKGNTVGLADCLCEIVRDLVCSHLYFC